MKMAEKLPITAIIMTYNEGPNLTECLESIRHSVERIVVVDSFSTDNTLQLAASFTDGTYQHAFTNQARQFAWTLANAEIRTEWIMRIDADERWTSAGLSELRDIIENDKADGVYVKMKIFFMGRWIRHGGFYPNYFMRVLKWSKGTVENRWMDEHIHVDGRTVISNIDVIESNYDRQFNIGSWTTKHNNYSTREAIGDLLTRHGLADEKSIANFFGNKTERKRWIKENIYFRAPLLVRPFLYFTYRYICKFGFLDGMEGFIFHTLQAFWYRFLVDAKIYQIERIARAEKKDFRQIIKEHYGLEV
jgi:glycosyltransferase involved in cell wall biosynthesis